MTHSLRITIPFTFIDQLARSGAMRIDNEYNDFNVRFHVGLKLNTFKLPELKAKVNFYSHFCRPSICPTAIIFYLFSRTTEPILTIFGTNHNWAKEIQVC